MSVLSILLLLLGVALISGTCFAVAFQLSDRGEDPSELDVRPRCELESTVGNQGCCPDACAGCVYVRRQ